MVRRALSVVLGLALWLPLVAAVGTPATAMDTPAGRLPSTVPVKGTPHVLDGRVYSVVEMGDTILLGGTFTQARNDDSNTQLKRSGLLAFDKTTGRISTTFVPQPNGPVEVLLPAADGQSVYVGGKFTEIAGQSRRNLVRLNLADGSLVDQFDAGAVAGKVDDLRLSGGRLWVAGAFTHISGQAQQALATLNPTTGAFDPYMRLAVDGVHNGGSTAVRKIDITPDGRDLVAIGNFRTLEGVRSQQVLRMDLSSPTAARPDNWQTAFFETVCSTNWYSYVYDVDISPDGSFFVIVTSGTWGGSSTACDSSSRWEMSSAGSGITPSWLNKTGGDTQWSVEITDSAVYVGGHARWQNNPFMSNEPGPGAVARPGIAALDPVNGLPLTWNPTRTRGVGVFDMLATADGLWVASDTDRIGDHHYRGRIALMPWSGGTSFPAIRTPGLPDDLYVTRDESLVKHAVTSTSVGGPASAPAGVDWRSVKGAFMLNGEVYLAMSDGTFVKRRFEGEDWGAPVAVDTQDAITPLAAWADDIRAMTGMFHDSGRIYFTRAKSTQLFFRYFSPESKVVGAHRYVASASVTGISFDRVSGMFVAEDRLYWSVARQSELRSIEWARGAIAGAPVAGTATVVSGGGVDGNDWGATRSPFLYQDADGSNAGEQPAGEAPTADFTASCAELTCGFDASSSRPGSSPIASYRWEFGDGSSASGATASHTYAASGSYTVRLTVTDSDGLTGTTSKVVGPTGPAQPEPPVADFTASCAGLTCSFDGTGSSDPDGDEAGLRYAWDFGDGSSGTGATASHAYAASGSYPVRLTVTDSDGLTGTTTRSVSPSEAGVVPVASVSTNGNRVAHQVTVPGAVQPGDQLLLLFTMNDRAPTLTGPQGWSLVPGGAVEGTNMRQRVWTKVATDADAGSVLRVTTSEYTKSDLTVAAYRATPGATLSVTGSAGSVGASGLTSYTTPTVELPATGSSWVLSYWGSKSSEGRTWTAPGTEVVRTRSSGSGGGAVSALLADSGEGSNGARGGGLVGTLDTAASQAQTFTVVLTAESRD